MYSIPTFTGFSSFTLDGVSHTLDLTSEASLAKRPPYFYLEMLRQACYERYQAVTAFATFTDVGTRWMQRVSRPLTRGPLIGPNLNRYVEVMLGIEIAITWQFGAGTPFSGEPCFWVDISSGIPSLTGLTQYNAASIKGLAWTAGATPDDTGGFYTVPSGYPYVLPPMSSFIEPDDWREISQISGYGIFPWDQLLQLDDPYGLSWYQEMTSIKSAWIWQRYQIIKAHAALCVQTSSRNPNTCDFRSGTAPGPYPTVRAGYLASVPVCDTSLWTSTTGNPGHWAIPTWVGGFGGGWRVEAQRRRGTFTYTGHPTKASIIYPYTLPTGNNCDDYGLEVNKYTPYFTGGLLGTSLVAGGSAVSSMIGNKTGVGINSDPMLYDRNTGWEIGAGACIYDFRTPGGFVMQ